VACIDGLVVCNEFLSCSFYYIFGFRWILMVYVKVVLEGMNK
jgi:hypothetical protein